MGDGKRAGENDESAIRFACDLLDGIFEIGSAAHGKRNYLHTRRQGPFKVRELPLHGVCRIVNNSNADCRWRHFPEHLSPFCSEDSQRANPVTLPPGRAGLATRPAATGSLTCANTIGKVLAVCCSAIMAASLPAK